MTRRTIAILSPVVIVWSIAFAVSQERNATRDDPRTTRPDDKSVRSGPAKKDDRTPPRDRGPERDVPREQPRGDKKMVPRSPKNRSERPTVIPEKATIVTVQPTENDDRTINPAPPQPPPADGRQGKPVIAAPDLTYVLEGYPPELLARLEIRDRALRRRAQEADIDDLEAVVTIGKLWRDPTITVAFRGGDNQLHRRIAEVATEWTQHGAFKFDFGHDATRDLYRTWTRQDADYAADIRVSFDDRGYYSLVGTDSRDTVIVRPDEASMNFGGFHITLPSGWQATVLHEFGHALGLQHEHQHPEEGCDFRFEDDLGYQPTRDQLGQFIRDSKNRRPGLYTLLGGPPNEWSRAVVDFNLKKLPDSRALFQSGPFDAKSIMKYHFQSWMFQSGDESPCESTSENQTLSPGDRKSITQAYPATRSEKRALEATQAQRQELMSGLEALALPRGPRSAARSNAGPVPNVPTAPLKDRLARIRPKTSARDMLESAAPLAIRHTPRAQISAEQDALERVIESADFLPAEFMVTGSSRQACVGRIAFKATFTHPFGGTFFPDEGWGTGFLVAPSLLLTNNHVLENDDFTANKVKVQFNYQRRLADGVIGDIDSYDFEPSSFFYTNAALDFTLVRVKGKPATPVSSGGTLQLPGTRWGQLHLADSLAINDASFFEQMSLNIVQHPDGRPKEVAIHNNFFERLLPNHIRYTTDTEGGSSGSPVFDNRWIVFALHHSAGDQNPDGSWKNNEGVRIDKIIHHILSSADIPNNIKAELGF